MWIDVRSLCVMMCGVVGGEAAALIAGLLLWLRVLGRAAYQNQAWAFSGSRLMTAP